MVQALDARRAAAAAAPACNDTLIRGVQVRLSERNVVELVAKLRQLGLLGDELLYTTNGA